MITKPYKISFRDILSYITCPLKLKLKTNPEILTNRSLYIKCAKATIDTYLNARANGFTNEKATKDAIRKFDTLWLSNIDKIDAIIDIHRAMPDMLFTKLSTFYNYRDEIVATNFPIEMSMSPSVILTDTIDLVLISSGGTQDRQKICRLISYDTTYEARNKRLLDLRASFARLVLQRYLNYHDNKRAFSFELRPFFGKDITLEPAPGNYNNLRRLVLNICEAIKQDVSYPTINEQACKDCEYSSICSVKLI